LIVYSFLLDIYSIHFKGWKPFYSALISWKLGTSL